MRRYSAQVLALVWVVALATACFQCLVANGSEPKLRLSPKPETKPAQAETVTPIDEPLKPVPETKPLPEQKDQPWDWSPDDLPDNSPPVKVQARDTRTIVYVYRLPTPAYCPACVRQEADEVKLPGIKFVHLSDAPAWVKSSPTIHYPSAIEPTGWASQVGWTNAENFMASFMRHNPPAALVGAASGLADQIRLFTGDTGSFDIRPGKPMRSVLDDGSVLSWTALRGKWGVENGVPVIYLAEPQPRVDTKKFALHFGATIYQIRLQSTEPPSVMVGTSLGRYTIELKPAK